LDEADFRRLVSLHELACRDDPRRFTRDTALMAGLGQAMILGMLALAIGGLWLALGGLFGGSHGSHGWFKPWRLLLAAGCGSLLLSIAGALWMRQQAPPGLVLTAAEAPALFKLIARLRKRCGGPRLDQVLIDNQLNAAIVQQPRLGVLGWHRNTLILGLPLLMALDLKQLAAVLAHEFGHLRGDHGKLGAWIYRTRRSWWLLAVSRERSRVGASLADWVLNLFFQHFFPRFNARAFVLSRQQEVEADRLAHQAVGPQPAALSLVSIAVQARYLSEHFWPRLWAAAEREPEPKATPMRDMRILLKDGLRHDEAPRWLREALKALPDASDTHPSLRERLELAKVQPALPAPPAQSAAEQLLGSVLPKLIQTLDAQWRDEATPTWQGFHRRHRQRERLLAELAEAHARQRLPLADHMLWARTAWQVHDAARAQPILRDALAADTQPPPGEARLLLAMALLDGAGPVQPQARQPEPPPALAEALKLLNSLAYEQISSLHLHSGTAEPRWRLPAAQRLEQVLEQREDFEGLKKLRPRLRELGEEAEAAETALHDFDDQPLLAAAQLSPRVLRPTLELLRSEPAAGRAWLLRKTSHAAPGWALLVLVVERSSVMGQPGAADWWHTLREQVELPMQVMVIDLAHPYWKDDAQAAMVQRFRQTAGANIYAAKTAR